MNIIETVLFIISIIDIITMFISGCLAGLSEYFDWDVTNIFLAAFIISSGIFAIYLIMAIVMNI